MNVQNRQLTFYRICYVINYHSLTILYISNNKLKDDGIIRIFQALKTNCTLKELHACKNYFGNHQTACVIADCLELNCALKTISLNENNFTVASISCILTSILKNEKQNLRFLEILPCQQLKFNDDEVKQINKLHSDINSKRPFLILTFTKM